MLATRAIMAAQDLYIRVRFPRLWHEALSPIERRTAGSLLPASEAMAPLPGRSVKP